MNVISGNGGNGVEIAGFNAANNSVRGNYIGTNITGQFGLPNLNGIAINNASTSTIGGLNAGERNIISGNTATGLTLFNAVGTLVQGNYIGTDSTGLLAIPGATGVLIDGGASNNTIGGTAVGARNIISGNSQSGLSLQSTNLLSGTISY